MNSLLKQFYIDLNNWVDDGYERDYPFILRTGLCFNLNSWRKSKSLEFDDLHKVLKAQFMDAGLDLNYPFNKSGEDYQNEQENCLLYKNTKRLAWIKEHAQ